MAEYKTKVHQHKIDAVDEIKESFKEVKDYIFTDFRGLTVSQITELRNKLREQNAEYHVIKNRKVKLAFQQMDFPDVSTMLVGPTALALSFEESGPVAKTIIDFGKETSVNVKGAIINGQVFDSGQVDSYSKLPTRDELLSKLMATMKAPLQNFVYALNGVPQKLVRVLQAVADKKKES